MAIKVIETRYKGCRFRSRLEARWAVFFDALEIRWEYEPQGFVISWMNDVKEVPYLPDFRLPVLGTWVEVKGSLGETDDCYLETIANAIDWGGQLPDVADSDNSTRGLLWLGPIPSADVLREGVPLHPILQHSKGGLGNLCVFGFRGFHVMHSSRSLFDSSWGFPAAAEAIRPFLDNSAWYSQGRILKWGQEYRELVGEAYRTARSARFEHGESL